jgi:HK97 family phage portal protein
VSFLSRIFGAATKSVSPSYEQVIAAIDSGMGVVADGQHVNNKTALQVSTVLACVKVIAEGCATPKLHVYREQTDRTRERATNIPEYRLLCRRANEWQTAFEWRRMMTMHACLAGAGLSIKVRGNNNRVRELIPVPPERWDCVRTSRYDLVYRCFDDYGMIGEFPESDVFLLRGLQWDWAKTLSAVHLARTSIGLAMASEKSQSAMHKNALRTSGILSVEGNLSDEQYQKLTGWLSRRSGAAATGVPLLLDRGTKWTSTSMSGVDAQHVETRRLQIEEICRGFGVFPIMIGHADKTATFASSESFFAAHLIHTLAPWHEAWTQRIDETLLDGSGPLFAEFDTRYMRNGSMRDRAQWARTMAEMGIYTRNEIRDEEGKDPLEGLDEPLTPMNMNGAAPAANSNDQTSP